MTPRPTAPARARPHRGARQESHPLGPILALLDPMKTTQQDKTVQSLERQLNAFRQRQAFDGSIPDPAPQDIAALLRIQATGTLLHARYGQARMIGAWEQDIAAWLAAGLDTPPCFDRVRDAYQPPPNGLDGLFIGPVITANGPPPRGYHLEFFIARREDPPEVSDLEWSYPHPKNKCESARLLAASAGFMEGNCIVFFPENIRARDKVSHQQYALFFFNKFQKIYEEITLRNTTTFIGADLAEAWMGASRGMAPEDCYRARCVWGYLHDYYHHRGPMPLDTNLQLKLNWHAGLLEEIKVDSQVVLECLDPRIAYGASVIEFVLLERLFRYPLQVDVCRNFDSGTGVFLFEWLAEHGAIALDGGRITAFGREAIYGALRSLVETIEALERSARGDDYKALARQFVYRYLRPPSQEGDRFDIPPRMRAVLDAAHRPERELQFADLAY
ncbi:DUF6421 family protein [Acidovorax sp. NCPPB 2350]|nr:DUF6421 family protein [Acidovorax sp. NCPPB 2350]